MSWSGKLFGGALGLMLGGPIGGVLGVALGHKLDNRAGKPRFSPHMLFGGNRRERKQGAFFATTFSVMGYLAKVDGRVTAREIELAEKVMARMELNQEMRELAIQLFNEGKQPGFAVDDVLEQFRRMCRRNYMLVWMFIEIQMAAAYADGEPNPAERNLLIHICGRLGVTEHDFARLEQIIRAERHFSGGYQRQAGTRTTPARTSLNDAYALLNVAPEAEIDDIKRSYRRMMNQHHPDKLVAKGLPEEMMKLASHKTHEIKTAYEQIRRQRGF
ncbi:MAG: DnaJ-like protein DjlA [Gammaproteobacteria bacterium]|nr:MAG: DnaJ-like protein DjlA [Gammaproteobacteria bacterium]TND02705.1 MAG: DnaJ-like protein DjlA [Gammaproteobacteria bacterium]